MKPSVITETIYSICAEVNAQNRPPLDWCILSEEELMYEAAVCIVGSQTAYELAVATADHLRHSGLFQFLGSGFDRAGYEACIVSALSDPVVVLSPDGIARWMRPRFHRRSASLLAKTRANIHGAGMSIKELLLTTVSAKDARQLLVRQVSGFGPKQASLFLRRIGFSADLAVLDVHIIDYLRIAWGLTYQLEKLARLPFYEHVEDEFCHIADTFGYSVGCVDLATWLTMRVAKREAYI